MTTINNVNGSTYEVLAEVHNRATGDNVLLLAHYGNKTATEIRAGASPVKYIVARGWSEVSKSWDSGKYFLAGLDHDAKNESYNVFLDTVQRVLY